MATTTLTQEQALAVARYDRIMYGASSALYGGGGVSDDDDDDSGSVSGHSDHDDASYGTSYESDDDSHSASGGSDDEGHADRDEWIRRHRRAALLAAPLAASAVAKAEAAATAPLGAPAALGSVTPSSQAIVAAEDVAAAHGIVAETAVFTFDARQTLHEMAKANRRPRVGHTGEGPAETPEEARQILLSLRNKGLQVAEEGWSNAADRETLLAEINGGSSSSSADKDSILVIKSVRLDNFAYNIEDHHMVAVMPTIQAEASETSATIKALGGKSDTLDELLRSANVDPALAGGHVVASHLPRANGKGSSHCILTRKLDGDLVRMALHCGKYSGEAMDRDVISFPGLPNAYVRANSPLARLYARSSTSEGAAATDLAVDANGFVTIPHAELRPHIESVRLHMDRSARARALSPNLAIHLLLAPSTELHEGEYKSVIRAFDSHIRSKLSQLEQRLAALVEKLNAPDKLKRKKREDIRDAMADMRVMIDKHRAQLANTKITASGTLRVEYYRIPLKDASEIAGPAVEEEEEEAAESVAAKLGAEAAAATPAASGSQPDVAQLGFLWPNRDFRRRYRAYRRLRPGPLGVVSAAVNAAVNPYYGENPYEYCGTCNGLHLRRDMRRNPYHHAGDLPILY